MHLHLIILLSLQSSKVNITIEVLTIRPNTDQLRVKKDLLFHHQRSAATCLAVRTQALTYVI